MQNPLRRFVFQCASAASLSLLVGCGPSGPNEVKIDISGNDMMKYSDDRFEIDAPAKVTVNFYNVGKQPKVAMGHNFVLLKKGTDALAFSQACLTAGATPENEYLPEKMRDQALGWTKILGPGEKETLVIDIPEAGTYPYVCTFPGHFANMKGVLIAR